MSNTTSAALVTLRPVITLDSNWGGERDGKTYHRTHEPQWLATALDLHVGMELAVQEIHDPDECRWIGTLTDMEFVRGELWDYVRLEIEEGEWIGPKP